MTHTESFCQAPIQNTMINRQRLSVVALLKIFVIITTTFLVVHYSLSDDKKIISSNTTPDGLTTPPMTNDFKGKKSAIIFVGIVSAPRLIFRRNALRRSWLNQCKENGIPCLFFTDGQDMSGTKLPDQVYVPLQQEQLLHKDLILTQSPGGINFARRYLWMLNWAYARYDFKYFLRIDDDYFVCIDRLLRELPHRPRTKLYWGHVHCKPPGG